MHEDLAGAAEQKTHRLAVLSICRGEKDGQRPKLCKSIAGEDDRVGRLLRAEGEVLEEGGEDQDPSEEGDEIEDDKVDADKDWLFLLCR